MPPLPWGVKLHATTGSRRRMRIEDPRAKPEPAAKIEDAPLVPQPPQPLALTDEMLATIRAAAAPIAPELRGQFLEGLAQLLAGERPLGAGGVYRACCTMQKKLFNAPDLTRSRGYSNRPAGG